MFKVMAFLVKKSGISTSELIEHYEHEHVALITRLGPQPLVYRRNYVADDDRSASSDDFDVITELVFQDKRSYEEWVSVMYAPDSGVAADEETFLDRARTRSYVVEEHTSSG